MKGLSGIFFFIAVAFCFFAKYGKAQQLSFEYDAAGNQTKREFICINCAAFAPLSAPSNSKYDFVAEAPKTNTLNNSNIDNQKIVAYPNPLTETLNIKWIPIKTYITSIEVYSMTGVNFFRQTYNDRETDFQEAIQFTKMPAGMYVVKVAFATGMVELLKVVKQ